jgi:hypothetical protein
MLICGKGRNTEQGGHMTCYARHLKEIFDEAGVEFTKGNIKHADKYFKKWLGKSDCPETWRELKIRLGDPSKREEVVKNLKTAFTLKSK